MSSLYKKMHQVMMDSEAIEKNMTVGDGGKSSLGTKWNVNDEPPIRSAQVL